MPNREPTRLRRMRRVVAPLLEFLRTEAAGGALLVGAALVALVWANSPWKSSYADLWHHRLGLHLGGHGLELDLQHWVNDGLMTVFFLVVGLEIKRELTGGHLAGRRNATLPVAAALGGMVVPALLYLAVAGRTAAHGWGVPMATDIALAVGVVALAGAAVPSSLRAYLLGLAVVDDIGAIVVIAVFYSSGVTFGWLGGAGAALLVTLAARRIRIESVVVYVIIGTVLWFALHEGGVHPTLAGVAMGLLAPASPRTGRDQSTVEWLEHLLHPWSSYLIVPLFALANAGIEVSVASLRAAWGSAITWGIIAGLVLGKPLGVIAATRLTVRAGLADPPAGVSGRQLLGVGNAAGIGFTVALFVAELAYRSPAGLVDESDVAQAKMAILVASVVSAAFALVLARQSSSPSSPSTSASPSR